MFFFCAKKMRYFWERFLKLDKLILLQCSLNLIIQCEYHIFSTSIFHKIYLKHCIYLTYFWFFSPKTFEIFNTKIYASITQYNISRISKTFSSQRISRSPCTAPSINAKSLVFTWPKCTFLFYQIARHTHTNPSCDILIHTPLNTETENEDAAKRQIVSSEASSHHFPIEHSQTVQSASATDI